MEYRIHTYEALDSTNTKAAEEGKNGAPEGTVIVAKSQVSGEGRLHRKWQSPEGGLWFSMVLRPRMEPILVPQLTLLSGVTVIQALHDLYSISDMGIKWPNDILVGGKKVCGILSEAKLTSNGMVDYVVMGIGININLTADQFGPQVQQIATSMRIVSGKERDLNDVLETILARFSENYEEWCAGETKKIISLWEKYNMTIGQTITVKDDEAVLCVGKAVGIDEMGALFVESESGTIEKFNFGEISIRQ